MSIDVVEVVIWRESSVSGGSGAVQMFLRWQQHLLTLWVCKLLMLDRKSGSAGMPRPISYAVFCLKKKTCVALSTSEAKLSPLLTAAIRPSISTLTLLACPLMFRFHAALPRDDSPS